MMVKICGTTNREDAQAAIDGGATALGFIFYPNSPRYISPEDAARIIEAFPSGVWKVGVFVNEPPARVAEVALRLGLDVAQLHGEEKPEALPRGIRVWKAFRVGPAFRMSQIEPYEAEAFLLDSFSEKAFGGTGRTFDWQLARGATRNIIVSGGLDAANVEAAIREARPWGVDACSRLEISPGQKDHKKMAQFLKAALSATP